MLPKLLLVASLVWPTILGAGWWSRTHDGPVWLTATVYFTASHVCHQKPDRSFWSLGAPWPVCGRCAGLYLSAPMGALLAIFMRKRRNGLPPLAWLALAALPTAAIWILEHAQLAPITSLTRFVAALSLGFAT